LNHDDIPAGPLIRAVSEGERPPSFCGSWPRHREASLDAKITATTGAKWCGGGILRARPRSFIACKGLRATARNLGGGGVCWPALRALASMRTTARWTSPAADDFLATFKVEGASPASLPATFAKRRIESWLPSSSSRSFAPDTQRRTDVETGPGLPRNRTLQPPRKLRSVVHLQESSDLVGDLLASRSGRPSACRDKPARPWCRPGSSRAGGGLEPWVMGPR